MFLRSSSWLWLTALALAVVAGCTGDDERLSLADLSAAEQRYVTRFVVLERARAVALADPERGAALLDSLAAAWGDSAGAHALDGLSEDPRRAAALHDLLARILTADLDSLVHAPVERRLTAPVPDPDATPPPASAGR